MGESAAAEAAAAEAATSERDVLLATSGQDTDAVNALAGTLTLACPHRTEAVARARELGLIP